MALTTAGTVRDYAHMSKRVNKEAIPIATCGADYAHATGSDAVVTLVPPADRGICLTDIWRGYQTLATAPCTIAASDGTLVWGPFNVPVALGLNHDVFDPPMMFGKGLTVTVTLKDGSVTKDLLARGYVEGAGVV